jgi:hypothetical protein
MRSIQPCACAINSYFQINNSKCDLSTFSWFYDGSTTHNGSSGVDGPAGYVQSRFFPRNSASVIQKFTVKINGGIKVDIPDSRVFGLPCHEMKFNEPVGKVTKIIRHICKPQRYLRIQMLIAAHLPHVQLTVAATICSTVSQPVVPEFRTP